MFLLACTSGVLPGDLVDTSRPSEGAGQDTAVEQVDGEPWSPPSWDPYALPDEVPTVAIEIDPEAMLRMDAEPYTHDDEVGVFVDEEGVRHEVDLAYRGAYALSSVMSNYDLRNWKVKFAADDRYHERREWNFNYEPHVKQKLAYDLFRFAGVQVPGAQHVLLELNGEPQGIYLRYEDPDDERFLADSFGHDAGDLYKAGYDLPGEPVCWADLTWLGAEPDDYLCHYANKTGDAYEPLVGFVTELNELPDDELAAWFEASFDLESFLSYLVVSNFIANWDSYPQRPKNYWLYDRDGVFVFLPWDLDGTFSPWRDDTYNQMGTTADPLYNLASSEYDPVHAEEGTERPLVRRLFALPGVEAAYLERYAELSEDLLSEAYLSERVGALTELAVGHASAVDQARLRSYEADVQSFVLQRTAFVAGVLE